MKFYKIYLFLFLVTFVGLRAMAQSADDVISMEDYNEDLIERLVAERVNEYRLKNNADALLRHEALDNAATDQAASNMKMQRVDRQDDIGKRVKKYGGTTNATFLAGYISAGRGKNFYTYDQIAADALEKFVKSKKNKKILQTADYFYSGYGVQVAPDRRRIYVTLVLGKIDALNSGADKALRKSLPIKYTTKKRGLKPYNSRACKGCEKFENYRELYNGLSIEGRYVYLKYDNMKELRRLLRRDKDGFAVDIIQREQYPCGSENIIDNELPSKGIMLKPMYSAKIMKGNEVEGRRPKSFYGPIGKMKSKVAYNLPEDYELNLIVIQGKTKCKVVTRGYLEDGGIESLTLFNVYPDTAINTALGDWQPTAENATLSFIVPFEQGKSNYKAEDIQPILDTLNEPKYIVDEIFIEAHSSLEGDSVINARLQRERAESMIRAIEEIQASTVSLLKPENITTSGSWDIFQKQIKEDDNYAYFRDKAYEEVMYEMRDNKEIYKKLEPLLDKQRFAKVTMNITYDISGSNEEPFVISQLLKAMDANDGAKALKIQKFAVHKVLDGAYDASNYIEMDIPNQAHFASLNINKLYLDNVKNNDGKLDEDLFSKFEGIFEVAPENDFAAFNYYLTSIKYAELKDIQQVNEVQKGINELYSSKIPPNFVDALNLEYQFKVMDFVDTVESPEAEDLAESSLNKIKQIFKIEGSSWQNALKLGYIFMDFNDLDYATKIMAPFLDQEGVDEQFFYTFISAASHDNELIYTIDFRKAMTKAKEMNQTRFCQLFAKPYSSFQLLDHPLVKEEYCKSCR